MRTYTVSSTWCTLKYTPKHRRKSGVGGATSTIPTLGNRRRKRHRYKVSLYGASSKARQDFRLTASSWVTFVKSRARPDIFSSSTATNPRGASSKAPLRGLRRVQLQVTPEKFSSSLVGIFPGQQPRYEILFAALQILVALLQQFLQPRRVHLFYL